MTYIFIFKICLLDRCKNLCHHCIAMKSLIFVLDANNYYISVKFKFSKLASIQETSREITNAVLIKTYIY